MLDPLRLKTPPNHGDVLIAPAPALMAADVEKNATCLAACTTKCGHAAIAEWRHATRRSVPGEGTGPIVVFGHQPEWIHAGVWAKHVVVDRMARALGGRAINLVVDHDTPRQTDLRVPVVSGSALSVRNISVPALTSIKPFELCPAMASGELDQLRDEVRAAMGDRFDASLMPLLFEGLFNAENPHGWVDQLIEGRRRVEAALGLTIRDVRVSQAWWSPLLVHLLTEADRFARDYNEALAWYRAANRVRGARRPIPDLVRQNERIEVPLWGFRDDGRRRRIFVARQASTVTIMAERDTVFSTTLDQMEAQPDAVSFIGEKSGWRIRPRALTLTLWARLFLADTFIHGIGGAKYDRITDRIIERHFGTDPPATACVSATLHAVPDWQPRATDAPSLIRRKIRDLGWNPQRHGADTQADPSLMAARAAAVQRSISLRANDHRNRSARRANFDEIRRLNRVLAAASDRLRDYNQLLRESLVQQGESAIARDREYFFALHSQSELEALHRALPDISDFRV